MQREEDGTVRAPSRPLTVLAAFAVIYLVWGSTYLAILIGLESMPPFLLAAARFLVAGGALYAWLRLRGVPRPSDSQWWAAVVTGTLMLVGGVGGITWAEQRLPSGIAALLIATVPLWMTILDVAVLCRSQATWRVVTGVGLGAVGVVVLIGPDGSALGGVDLIGALVVVVSALSWSIGSLVSRGGGLPDSPTMTVAVQMVSGGVVLLLLSGATGEWRNGFSLAEVTARSAMAMLYLAVLGSIVALSAYVWLLRQVSAPAVATYAFVNPVVAVFLGWAVASEVVSRSIVLATVLILGAVGLIQSETWLRRRTSPKGQPAPVAAPSPAASRAVAPVLAASAVAASREAAMGCGECQG